MNYTYSDELYHYGVRGQKWGVRRYQNEDGTLTEEGRIHYGRANGIRYGGSEKESYIDKVRRKKYSVQIDNDTQTNTEKHTRKHLDKTLAAVNIAVDIRNLSASLPLAALGAVSGNPLVFALGAYGTVSSGSRLVNATSALFNERRYFKKREEESKLDKKTGLYKKTKELTDKEDLSNVNPAYGSYNIDKHNNCMLCTTTYDLRRRGYDVTSNVASYGYTNGDIKRWYPKAKINDVSAQGEDGKYSKKALVENTISELSKQKNSRGNLTVAWDSHNGGHSMVYEVNNGKVRILDGQTNKIYENPEKILNKVKQVSYVRLDNIQPDFNKIKECVR